MKKLLFILMIIPMIGFGQTKIRNTQLTSGNQPSGKVLKSDGATNVVWGDDDGGTGHDSLTIAPGSTGYFDVNSPQVFSAAKLIDTLTVMNNKIDDKEPKFTKSNGYLKWNRSAWQWVSETYELAFNKNTAFNKNFGTVAGTVLEGRTFGSAANSSITDFAPASGSANYVQVSPSSPQVGNVWMGGSGTFDYGINVTTGSVNSYIHDGTGWIWSSTGISSGIIRGGIYAASDGSLNLFGGSTFSPNLKINNLGESIFSKKVQVGDYTSSSKFGAGGNSTTMNYHAYEDWTVTNSTLSPNLGYASFDAKPELTGSSINDHFVGFQSRPIYSSSGNLSSYMHGIDISCQHIGVGTISKSAQLNISDVGGLGPITNDYGIYISNISRGINNYSIYSDGGTAFFAGDIISGEDIVGGTLTIAGADLSTYKLAVGGDVWTDGNFTTTNGGGFFNNIKYNSGWKFVRNGYGNAIYQSGANLIFSAFGSGNSGDTAIESQCFVIKNNSAALLPTTASTSPTTGALTVAGGIGVSGDVNVFGFTNSSAYKLSGVDLYSSLTANTLEKWDGTKHTSISNASGYLYNDGTGSMSFTSLPAAVTSISAGNGMNFTTITGTGSVTLGTPTTLTASTTNAVTTTSHTHQITGFLPLTGGTLTGAVTSNNSFTGTNFILSSDKRLKQGIRTLTNTDWVERIKFVRYEMKSNPEIERYGVIAQDVEEVNKYLVYTDEYGIKSVSYIDLLVAKIANLEKRISELENKKKRHEK